MTRVKKPRVIVFFLSNVNLLASYIYMIKLKFGYVKVEFSSNINMEIIEEPLLLILRIDPLYYQGNVGIILKTVLSSMIESENNFGVIYLRG